jgi:hypothetical protein
MAMNEIDPRLSRLYHEASTEGPSPAVDAAILAAARQQVAAPRRRERSRWSRWLVPASLAAMLVVGVSTSLLIQREYPERLQDNTAGPVPSRQESPPANTAASGVLESETRHGQRSPAETGHDTPSSAEAFTVEQGVKSVVQKSARESNTTTDAALGLGSMAPTTSAPAAAKTAPMRIQTSPRSPDSWLDDIRRLKREGHDKEAIEQLAAFRRTYPSFIVPSDLAR